MIESCYSASYYVETKSKSMTKLKAVAEALEAEQLSTLIEPHAMDIGLLYQLHDPALVDAFLIGKKPLASLQGFPWSLALRDAVLAIHAGQLCAAKLAFKTGIAANIAQGFHHAGYEYGSGFCTFNGLALIAQQYPDKKIFVLDCDQHGGNGTAEFTQRLPNLFNYTIFGLRFGCRDFDRSIGVLIPPNTHSFEPYRAALLDGFAHVLDWQTDLIIYQAGIDCHQDDPCGGSAWCTDEALIQRDQMVFEFAKKYQIPIMFVLAGGYQQLDRVIALHLNTYRVCHQVFFAQPQVKTTVMLSK
jgi:acetoin utilization deacetylase AcuC-like enzyme